MVESLSRFPAVALLGPRQVGKTTLARMLPQVQGRPPPEYLDLENPSDRAKLEDAAGYLRAKADRLLIIDEVQRAPNLFQLLRGVIDQRIFEGSGTGHFLLLGSASIELLKQSSESLAGRIAYLELGPFDILELGGDRANALWVRGGFPRSILAPDDAASTAWRASFIATYLERDIPQLGPRIAAELLRRFWTMLAHQQGALLNASQLARSLGVDSKTVAAYVDLMVDLLLVRRLEPLHRNTGKRLVKAPKTYVRDSGIVHTLMRLDSLDDVLSHPIAGATWEGHVVETLLRVAPPRTQPSFYRTAAGAEIDLVLDLPGNRRWVVEVKRGAVASLGKGFHSACADVEPDRAFVVYGGDERFPKAPGVEAIGLYELAAELVQLHAPTGSGVDDPPARAQRTGAARTQMRNESPRKSS